VLGYVVRDAFLSDAFDLAHHRHDDPRMQGLAGLDLVAYFVMGILCAVRRLGELIASGARCAVPAGSGQLAVVSDQCSVVSDQ
jgi:hypothetical protein